MNETEEVELEINPYDSFDVYYQLGIPISNVTVIDGSIQISYMTKSSELV